MQDAIVRSMADANHWLRKQINREGLWQVVIVERDDMGTVIKNNPKDVVLVTDVTWDRATSVANEFRMTNKKPKEPMVSVALLWDIRYRESGKERFRIEQDFFWETLQEFVKDREVTSITLYADGFTKPVGPNSHDKSIYQESLTKNEFLEVNEAWIEDRKKKIGLV